MEDILLPNSFLHFKIASFPSNQFTNPLECEIMWFLGQKIQDNLVAPNAQYMSSAEKLLQHLLYQGRLLLLSQCESMFVIEAVGTKR